MPATTVVRDALYRHRRWLYRGGRPNPLARAMNRTSAWLHSAGLLGSTAVTLEVRGRRSGRLVSFPLVLAQHERAQYLVSMLGEDAQWVHNVRADGGRAVLSRRGPVRLVEVPVDERAPILRRYLELAPGARAHIPVDRRAPLADFVAVAARYPVFRVVPHGTGVDTP